MDSLIPLAQESDFVRLGLDVEKTGMLRPDREAAAIAAIKRFKQIAVSLGAETVLAIATSAVREARNGGEFARRVQQETGVEVRIINGQEEAELTFLGATLGLNVEEGAIVADLGGGSAEIISANRLGVCWADSLPLGSGRLTELYLHHDPPGQEELRDLCNYVRSLLRKLPDTQATRAIFTGGTASQVIRLAGKRGETVELTPQELEKVLHLLATTSTAEIVAGGASRERAAVLPAGVAALAEIVRYYSIGSIAITRHGIREGVIEASLRGELGF